MKLQHGIALTLTWTWTWTHHGVSAVNRLIHRRSNETNTRSTTTNSPTSQTIPIDVPIKIVQEGWTYFFASVRVLLVVEFAPPARNHSVFCCVHIFQNAARHGPIKRETPTRRVSTRVVEPLHWHGDATTGRIELGRGLA
jgi:hypothetical protein